MLSKIVTVPDL